jgi:large repetitive protein
MRSVFLFIAALLVYTTGIGQCPVINVSGIVTDAACYNQKNGSVKLTVTGGTGPYTYQWSNLSTGKDLNNVYAGNYSVEVTDANGCKGSQTFTVAQPGEIVITTIESDPSCYNSNNGSISPSATGGTGAFTYSFENGSSTFTGLGAGTYEIIATDSRGCIGRSTVTLTAPAPIEILSISSKKYLGYDVRCNGASDGEITVNAIGGTGALQYSVNGGAFQSGNVITGLSAGTYVITVKDQNGCTLSNDYQSMIDNPGIIISPPVTLVAPAPLELGPINANPWQLLVEFLTLSTRDMVHNGSYFLQER